VDLKPRQRFSAFGLAPDASITQKKEKWMFKQIFRRTKKLARPATLMSIATVAFAIVSSPGGGVDDNSIFELDGNTITTQSQDWDKIFSNSSTAAVTAFTTDVTGAGDDILTGGTTKDTNDFSKWAWKQNATTGVQDKDDLEHAFAAAYRANGHTLIYFGADRFSNSGDSQIGFWFVQDPNVAINHNASGGASGGFDGKHIDGDILIVAHFVNGGAVPQITLYQWSGGTIVQVGNVDTNLCNSTTGTNSICAITNSGSYTTGGWTYTEKASDSPQGTGVFMEGGIDINAFFPTAPCISRFFAETRSSQSTTATLSDFTVPVPFSLCSVDVAKTCSTGALQTAADGSNFVRYTFSGSVSTASGPVFDPTVKDTFPTGATNTHLGLGTSALTTPSCTPVGGVCTVQLCTNCSLGNATPQSYSGYFDVPAPLPASSAANPSGTNPNQIQATASASEGGPQTVTSKVKAWVPNDLSGQSCHVEVGSNLTLAKGCEVDIVSSGSNLFLRVQTEIKVCSTVPVTAGGVQIKGINLTDSVTGSVASNLTLNAPASSSAADLAAACRHFYPHYDPSTCSSTDGRCAFSDTVTLTGAQDDFGNAVSAPVPSSATCRVCPSGACSGVSDTPLPDALGTTP
jgi:glutamine cyclotransferase